jgi:hypothetical protein
VILDANDPTHRAMLKVARAWGVPPSVVIGQEPGQETAIVHQYDDSGRLVRSVVEQSWSEDDISSAVSLLVYEADSCPGCGDQLSETTAPENEFAYKVGLPVRCHRCTASGIASDQYTDPDKGATQPQALFMQVELRKGGESNRVRSESNEGTE